MALDSPDGLFERVRLNLGRGSHATIVSYIPEWVNITQREVCKEAKFWFCHAEATGALVVTNDTITLPTNFVDDDYLFLRDSSGFLSEVTSIEHLEYRKDYTDLTGSSYQDRPIHYVLRETDILLRPIVDDSYTYILGYWKTLTDLAAGGASNKLLDVYPSVLECGATEKGFRYMQEYDDANYWRQCYEREVQKIKIANAERDFPDEMTLSVRPGRGRTSISRRVRRTGY